MRSGETLLRRRREVRGNFAPPGAHLPCLGSEGDRGVGGGEASGGAGSGRRPPRPGKRAKFNNLLGGRSVDAFSAFSDVKVEEGVRLFKQAAPS